MPSFTQKPGVQGGRFGGEEWRAKAAEDWADNQKDTVFYPVVYFATGKQRAFLLLPPILRIGSPSLLLAVVIKPHSWAVDIDKNNSVARTQLPLQLAWALVRRHLPSNLLLPPPLTSLFPQRLSTSLKDNPSTPSVSVSPRPSKRVKPTSLSPAVERPKECESRASSRASLWRMQPSRFTTTASLPSLPCTSLPPLPTSDTLTDPLRRTASSPPSRPSTRSLSSPTSTPSASSSPKPSAALPLPSQSVPPFSHPDKRRHLFGSNLLHRLLLTSPPPPPPPPHRRPKPSFPSPSVQPSLTGAPSSPSPLKRTSSSRPNLRTTTTASSTTRATSSTRRGRLCCLLAEGRRTWRLTEREEGGGASMRHARVRDQRVGRGREGRRRLSRMGWGRRARRRGGGRGLGTE